MLFFIWIFLYAANGILMGYDIYQAVYYPDDMFYFLAAGFNFSFVMFPCATKYGRYFNDM